MAHLRTTQCTPPQTCFGVDKLGAARNFQHGLLARVESPTHAHHALVGWRHARRARALSSEVTTGKKLVHNASYRLGKVEMLEYAV